MAVIKIPDGKGGWVRLPTVKGDRGPQGLQGPRGFKGDDGRDGKNFTYFDFTEDQLNSLKQPAIDAAVEANEAKTIAKDTLIRTNDALLEVNVAVRDTIVKTEAAKIATEEAQDATIIALNSKGPKGDPFRINAVGTLAQRSLHDDKGLGYCFLDYVDNKFYVKKSEASGDWTDGITFVGSVGNINSEQYSEIDYENGKIHRLKDEGDPIYPITNPEAVLDERNNMTLRDHLNNIPIIEVLSESEFDNLQDKDENKFYFIQED